MILILHEQDEDTALRNHYAADRRKNREMHILHEMLKQVDPASAEMIHANNVKRTIRALEYFDEDRRTNFQNTTKQERAERHRRMIFAYFVLNRRTSTCYMNGLTAGWI